MYVKLALRNIFRNRSRSLITLLAIGSGAVALIMAGGFIEDTLTRAKEDYIHAFLGHVRVYPRGFLEEGLLHPFDHLIAQPEELIRELRHVPHVLYAAPRLSFAGLLSTGESTVSFFAEGIDPQVENAERSTAHLESGTYLQGKNDYQMLLGKGLAKAMGIRAGDAITVVTNTKRGAINAADMSVQGIFATSDKAYDDRTARLPLAIAQKLLRADDVQTIIVFLDETAHTAEVKSAMERLLRNKGYPYEVKAWYELEEADFVVKAMAFYQRIFFVLKMIIWAVVTLSITNTMNMSVLERIGEIGTLMALGTRRRGIATLFLLEGVFLGVLGGIFGGLAGCALAIIISRIGIPMPSPPGSTMVWIARIAVTPGALGAAFTMALATALIASVVPAHRASRLDIGDALRHNI